MGPVVRFPSPREAEQQEGEGAQVCVVALLVVAAVRQAGSGRAGCRAWFFPPGSAAPPGRPGGVYPGVWILLSQHRPGGLGTGGLFSQQQDGDVHPKSAQMVVIEPFRSVENQREKDRHLLYFDTQRESCATAGSQRRTRMLHATGHVVCGVLAVALSTRRFLF